MPIKSYPIWSNKALVLPIFVDKAEISSVRSITWKDGTTINSAQIVYTMKPGLDGVQCWLDLNGIELAHESWNIGDVREKSGSADATSALYNGGNIFVFRGDKGLGGFLERTILITANLIVDYTGEDLVVPKTPVNWLRTLLYGTAVVVTVGAAVITTRAYGAKRIATVAYIKGLEAERRVEQRLRERFR